MYITQAQLNSIFGQESQVNTAKYLAALNTTFNMDLFEITTTNRIAGFLSQVGVESGVFQFVEEDLYYSAIGLLRTFPSHFANEQIAEQYAMQPEKIANRVYANRYGNGPESSGDGWLYRGRGLIQITFKDNYQSFANFISKPLADVVTFSQTTDGAVQSAAWYWAQNNLNSLADRGDIDSICYRVAGSYEGLSQRVAIWNSALKVLTP